MSTDVRFTSPDWEQLEQAWSTWWAGELDRPLVVLTGRDPAISLPESQFFVTNFPPSLSTDEILDRYQAHLEATIFYADAFPKWWPNFGPGVTAAFLGAAAHCRPETVWFSPARSIEITDLALRYDPDNFWWGKVRQLTQRAVTRWEDKITVGHTDLGLNFDILAGLRTTQQLLLELVDAPEEVARLLRQLTQLWLRYYDELYDIVRPTGRGTSLWADIWSPDRCYMLQSDFSYMISPKMFERFVLPDLAACCDALGYCLYHLDGKGQLVHLDLLIGLESLRGIQWVPGQGQPPPEAWMSVLKRIRDGGKLCQLNLSAKGALQIVRELGGRGFAFSIGQKMSPAEAEDYLRRLASEDKDRPRSRG